MTSKRARSPAAAGDSRAAAAATSVDVPQAGKDAADDPIVIHINEPIDAAAGRQLRRVGTGQYAAPFVVDDGEFLQLHFTMRYTQSRMSLRSPDTLSLDYTRRMMACLLFQPAPMHVEIVGLGGGSLTKFCYYELPHTRVTTIEVDDKVIGMSHLFRVPAPCARLSIVHADAAEYFQNRAQTRAHSADVVLVDGCDVHGIAPALATEGFYRSVRDRLRPDGVMVVNLVGANSIKDAAQRSIAKVFEDQFLLMNAVVGGNRIALAFRGANWPPRWAAIKAAAPELGQKHRLDLPGYAESLERWYRNRGRKMPR
ncbi:MAG: spermidine synthase-like protein [Hydrocarboniphaga sp.]|uniref:spermine/spermidine synthase domain-containing protein n=1 Tax=Hydrocarboniphaga sp. TaxID=2033016 RepID=UPI002607E7DE|nr:hypothetical protein [Hydrocarboniphaga sp.]MDB5970794.1 spermidine synthase-like protein [Hydrocarboniphaga sp.]